MKGFIAGAGCLMAGFRMIVKPGLRRFVVIPLIINTLLFGSLIAGSGRWFSGLMERLLPDYLGWLEWLLWPLFALMAILITFYTFTLVANLIGAPFNDRLAEKVAERLGANVPGASGGSLVGDVVASILGELRKWVYFLVLMVFVVLAWLLVTPLAPFLWLLLSAWMMSIEYGDYPLANAGLLKFGERRAWIRRHRWTMIGFGAATLGLTLIPIVNFAVMPAAVAGATIAWHRLEYGNS